MANLQPSAVIAALETSMPGVFTRREIMFLTGGMLPRGTLANLGQNGPPYLRSKRHAVYEKSSFLKWLLGYLEKDNKLDH